MEQQIVEALSQPVQAAITAEADYLASDSSTLCVHNEVILSHQTGDDIYRIGYILTEDDVHVPDDFQYAQYNSYALSYGCRSAFNIHGQRTDQRSGFSIIGGKKVYIFE